MSAFNIPDGGDDPGDFYDEEEVEDDDDDFSEPVYYEDGDWDERTERHWYPGPK